MIVAMSDAVQVAIVSGLLAGTIPAALAARSAHSSRQTSDRIGEPNGAGNVVQMLTRLLDSQTGQDQRIARLERVQHEHGRALVEHGEAIARMDGRTSTQDHPEDRPWP